MGQRHQAFLIARLIPSSSNDEQRKAYYRCIAVHHHQCCYGRLPLAATRRFLDLLSNTENADIVRDEIRRAQGKYVRQGQRPAMPSLSFPYAQFLLAQAWNMDIDGPDDPYASGVGFEYAVLDPNIGCFSHDNNDGISIIDITEPLDPAYCYAKDGRILTAEQYLRMYEDEDEDEEGNSVENEVDNGHISPLKDVRVLTSDVLTEVWPRYFSSVRGKHFSDSEGSKEHEEHSTKHTSLPPLAELALCQLVKQCVLDNDWEQLEQLADMPGKPEDISAALRVTSQKDIPDSGSALLAKLLQPAVEKEGGLLDLSRYTLSLDAIRAVIALLPRDNVKAVNLSGNQSLDPDLLVHVISTYPNLIRLTLLDTNITNEQVMDLLRLKPEAFYRLHNFIHPALLVRNPTISNLPKGFPDTLEQLQALHESVSTTPRGFTFVQTSNVGMMYGQTATMSSIPFFHPEKVLRDLTKFFSILKFGDFAFPHSFLQSQLGPSMVLAVGTPLKPQSQDMDKRHWSHRSISMVPIEGTYDKWRAHEWIFVLNYMNSIVPTSNSSLEQESTYAFIKVNEDAHSQWLFDLMKTEWEMRDGRRRNKETPEDARVGSGVSVAPFTSEHLRVYDARGFADAVEKEGRPRPSEEVIVAFEEAIAGDNMAPGSPPQNLNVWEMIAALGRGTTPLRPPQKPLKLMDVEAAKKYIPAVQRAINFK